MNQIIDLMQDFLDFDPRDSEIKAAQAPSAVFGEMARKQALEAFQLAAKTVPAYKDFLKKNRVSAEKITTFEDFQSVPLTDKKNYLSKYPLRDLMIEGSFKGKPEITSSSGSSGNPFYWPRFAAQDFGATKGWDSYLSNTFNIDKKATLHLNCSGLGVWAAGDYISLLNKYLSYKYPNNSSMSPGIDMDNTIKAVETISPFFDQTIIYSYPPFAKDIIDNLPPRLLRKSNIKLVVYGEAYSEKWREYILKKIGAPSGAPYAVSSVLGSADCGLIGQESVSCTALRMLAHKNPGLCQSMFGEMRVPSLVQFNPMAKFIEIVGNNVVITNKGGLPLIRYDTHDYGNLLVKEEISALLKEGYKLDFDQEAKKYKSLATSMPYLYVFGRSDYSASVYGVTVSPETIKDILSSNPFARYLSGKFVMTTIEDAESNQYLSFVCECKKSNDIRDVAIPAIEKQFADYLKIYSSEYAKLLSTMGSRVFPKVELRNYGDDEHFSSKNKQKYLI